VTIHRMDHAGVVVNYGDGCWLSYIRGPEGIIVELAERVG
jgi:hypothetical protein